MGLPVDRNRRRVTPECREQQFGPDIAREGGSRAMQFRREAKRVDDIGPGVQRPRRRSDVVDGERDPGWGRPRADIGGGDRDTTGGKRAGDGRLAADTHLDSAVDIGEAGNERGTDWPGHGGF